MFIPTGICHILKGLLSGYTIILIDELLFLNITAVYHKTVAKRNTRYMILIMTLVTQLACEVSKLARWLTQVWVWKVGKVFPNKFSLLTVKIYKSAAVFRDIDANASTKLSDNQNLTLWTTSAVYFGLSDFKTEA